jgi:hypothetical protein
VVHIVVATYFVDLFLSNGQQYNSHNNMNHSSVKPQTVMVNNITNHNNVKYCYLKPKTVTINNIASHNNMDHSSVKHETVMVNNITATTI